MKAPRNAGSVRRHLAIVVAALMLAPLASAGTEKNPEIVDTDPAPANGNLLAAWFETEPDTLRFTVKIEEVRGAQRDMFYLVAFTLDGTRILAGMGWDEDGNFRGYVGDTNAGRGGVGLETFANNRMRIAFEPGAPAYFRGTIPFDEVAGLEPGATLRDLHAGVTRLDRAARTWVDVDPHSTTLSYELKTRTQLVTGVALSPAAWTLLGAVVGGGGTALALRLRGAPR